MHPILFAKFVWEHLTLWSAWLNDKDHPGRADVIGAGLTAVIVALAVIAYVRRERLKGLFGWIVAHPVVSTILAAPVAALALINLSKFATFIGATLTTVGLLIALDNNRRNHDREARKFEREGKSAKAALALELSALADFCRAYVEAASKFTPTKILATSEDDEEQVFVVNVDPDEVKFPDIPPTTIATLKEVIKSTDNDALANRCMEILSYAQYVKGFASIFRDKWIVNVESNVNHAKLRTALLYALVESLFDYARGKSDSPRDVNWLHVDQATNSLNLSGNGSFLEYFTKHKHYENPLDILAK